MIVLDSIINTNKLLLHHQANKVITNIVINNKIQLIITKIKQKKEHNLNNLEYSRHQINIIYKLLIHL
jgi:hypothetical protein